MEFLVVFPSSIDSVSDVYPKIKIKIEICLYFYSTNSNVN